MCLVVLGWQILQGTSVFTATEIVGIIPVCTVSVCASRLIVSYAASFRWYPNLVVVPEVGLLCLGILGWQISQGVAVFSAAEILGIAQGCAVIAFLARLFMLLFAATGIYLDQRDWDVRIVPRVEGLIWVIISLKIINAIT